MDLARPRTKGHCIVIGLLILQAPLLALSEDAGDAVEPVAPDLHVPFDPAIFHTDVQPDILRGKTPFTSSYTI